METALCEHCKEGTLLEISSRILDGTTYMILECNNCGHVIARRKG